LLPKRWKFLILFPLISMGLFVILTALSTGPSLAATQVETTPVGRIATSEEIAAAYAEWVVSGHAETYDLGMGANATCARCKSPMNWDPTQELAAQEALNCGACKRVPGAPRPELETGHAVPPSEWIGIPCEVCHIPAGDSYYVDIAYWDQNNGQYELLADSLELCAKCHEGQHGFEVVEEQVASQVHQGWECTRCHGPHGSPSACTDCHDPTSGRGASEHARHPSVNCTSCHDNGGLSVWYDYESQSAHSGEYVTRRFAHTLTSWSSHNLSTDVFCQRCHHPVGAQSAVVVDYVSCQQCHVDGAMWTWCLDFERDPAPYPDYYHQP
jgi:hypothetical protein